MRKVKLYAILGVIVVIIGGIVARFLNNHSFVSDKFIKQKSDSISTLKKEVIMQDSLLWSLQQDIDLCGQNKSIREAVIAKLTKERDEARAEAKTIREAIEHYEANDLMRFFVFDKQGWFKKGCYQEVFEKPDNICK